MPTLTPPHLQQRVKVALQAAHAASKLMMEHYAGELRVNTKSSQSDLVTHVDLACDEAIRQILGVHYPTDTLLTEETYQEGQPIDLTNTWIVDPIDGTTNYAHAFPYFAVSIAYVENGQPQIGVIMDPFKSEQFVAIAGEPATNNTLAIRVSTVSQLEKSLLATGFPYTLNQETEDENNIALHTRFLKQCHGIRRAGAAALDMAYVAAGRLDGFWERKLSPWDVAAGILLVQAAGGQVTGFDGAPVNLAQRHIDIVVSNTHLHLAMLQQIQG